MIEFITHESVHSWVLPFPEVWNEPIATYVGNLVMIDMGHALPVPLKERLIATARANREGFAFWDEKFPVQAESRAETISSPRVITANQKEALIEQGVEIPYQESASSGATTTQFKKAVLSLKVTPQVTPDDRIIMDLEVTEDTVGAETSQGIPTTAEYEYWAPATRPLGSGGDMHFAFGFCAQAVLCEIDMGTGEVRVRKVIAAHDVGRAINPLTLEGQVEGGIVMCIGYALMEHYIQEQGRPWTDVMARYSAPRIAHAPEIVSHIVEHATSDGPFGAKGVGELPSIPTSAAITNAIQRATGLQVLHRIMGLAADATARAACNRALATAASKARCSVRIRPESRSIAIRSTPSA